jgi:hypothetical protein
MIKLFPEEEKERTALIQGIKESIQIISSSLRDCHVLLDKGSTAQDIMFFHQVLEDCGINFNLVDQATHRVMEIDRDAITRNN